MAINTPPGDNRRVASVRKRPQFKTMIEAEERWTKRRTSSGQFMDQKKSPTGKRLKGVRQEGVRQEKKAS